MAHLEGGMSPGEELAQQSKPIEGETAYSELMYSFASAETEEEKRLLKEAIGRQFIEAVNAGDSTRVHAIARNFRLQFGEPLLEAHAASAPSLEKQERTDPSTIEKELHNIIDPHWERAVSELDSNIPSNPLKTIRMAAEMKDFDPSRFDETVLLEKLDMKETAEKIQYWNIKRETEFFLELAAAFKKLVGPEKFAELIPLDIPWDRINDLCRGTQRSAAMTCLTVEKMVPGEVKSHISPVTLESIKKYLLPQIKAAHNASFKLVLLRALRVLKQEGEKDQRLSQSDWREIRNDLEDVVRYGGFECFFYCANMVKTVGVEEE